MLDVTQGPVTVLTLNDPARLNALSTEMLDALHTEVDRIGSDRDVKAVVIRGTGKAFCAGHDLREIQAAQQSEDKGVEALRILLDHCAALMLKLRNLPQPVIAEVHGIATAAGCQLAATCDMVVAAETARFGVNGVNIGLFCSTPMVALSRAIGQKAAFEMLTTGRFMHADEALRLGLATKVVPDDDLQRETLALAELVASKLSSAVRIGKGAFYAQGERSEAEAYQLAGDAMLENMLLDDTSEGIKAFLEKRPPNWTS